MTAERRARADIHIGAAAVKGEGQAGLARGEGGAVYQHAVVGGEQVVGIAFGWPPARQALQRQQAGIGQRHGRQDALIIGQGRVHLVVAWQPCIKP